MNARTTSLRSLAAAAVGAAFVLVAATATAGTAPASPQGGGAQTRAFDAVSRDQVLRAAMATLQDFGFVIESADSAAGRFTAERIEKYPLRITVTAQAKGERQVVVRADATYEDTPVAAPKPYQDFFAALDKALPVSSHNAD